MGSRRLSLVGKGSLGEGRIVHRHPRGEAGVTVAFRAARTLRSPIPCTCRPCRPHRTRRLESAKYARFKKILCQPMEKHI